MRQLARLKQPLNLVSKSDKPLISFITGAHFDRIVSAVESLCGFTVDNTGRRSFAKPSLALKLGHHLVKCALLKKGVAIRDDKAEMRQEAEAYLAFHTSEYKDVISSTALSMLKDRKYNKPQTEDLVKLKNYLEQTIVALTETLRQNASHSTWRQLSDVVLSRVITFNKRRGGEAAKLLLNAYSDRPQWDKSANSELIHSLQPLEKQLIKRLVYADMLLYLSLVSK